MRQVHGERKERKTNTDNHVRPRAVSQGVDLLELFAIQYFLSSSNLCFPTRAELVGKHATQQCNITM